MNNWLNPDNKFFSLMGKAFDTLVLNTIWLVLCVPLPVLTVVWIAQTENFLFLILTILALLPIVPATTALYYAIVKSVRRERSYAIKEFFRSFILNFKQGIVFSFIALTFAVVLYIDFVYVLDLMNAKGSSGSIFLGVFFVITLLLCSMYAYACPVLSRFEMKTTGILKISFVMAARHFPTTLLLLVILVATVLGCWFLLPGIFFLPAVAVLLESFLLERVFRMYMPEKEEAEEGEEETRRKKDEWYLE